LGLRAGTELYTANYATLNPYQQFDPNLAKDIKSASLFNFGAGMFWHKEDYYLGIGIPNIIENYFDKNEKNTQNKRARQVRGYYATTGYVFHSGETVDILPQVVARYSGNALYSLPFNADINVSFIFSKRVLFGVTYRTDKSLEGMMRIQATRNLSIGYSYDYLLSGLSGYNNGAHELILGIDFAKRHYGDYDKVHFITLF
jgi:type IX secretion system PorP/SprF family membrane protein